MSPARPPEGAQHRSAQHEGDPACMLAIDQLSKNFGGVAAVSDISMQVPAGSITGLIGPNGAGKTTLINLITGIYAVSGGSIRFGARDLTRAPAHMVARAGITRTFQNIRLRPRPA